MALVLFVVAAFAMVYSPLVQRQALAGVLRVLNKPGLVHYEIDAFRLRPPLAFEVEGVRMIDVATGDTMMAAESLRGQARLLPLLRGEARIDHATLTRARYIIGTPDSALYLRLKANSIQLSPATVTFRRGIDIALTRACIDTGMVAIDLNPDTTAVKSDTTAVTDMEIKATELVLKNFTYQMRMLPTIDSLSAVIADGSVTDALVDLRHQNIDIGGFKGRGLDATYTTPDAATIAATPVVPVNTNAPAAEPWTVQVRKIDFTHSQALYALQGWQPLPGLDFSYIQVGDLDLHVDNFYNRATDVIIPITRVHGTERCGVVLTANGTVRIDSTALRLNELAVTTPMGTDLKAMYMMGIGDMMADPTLPVALAANGDIAIGDFKLMFPAMAPLLSGFGATEQAALAANVAGTMGDLKINELALSLNHTLTLAADGRVLNVTRPDDIAGSLALHGKIENPSKIKQALADMGVAGQWSIPPMALNGNVDMDSGNIAGSLKAVTGHGDLALDASWHQRAQAYDLKLATRQFPVNAFMPELGLGAVTGTITAKGHGLDLFSAKTVANVDVDIAQAVYKGYGYSDLQVSAKLADGLADVAAHCDNANAQFALTASGNLDGDTYAWTANVDAQHIDLLALNLSETPMSLATDIDLKGSVTPSTEQVAATLKLHSLDMTMPPSAPLSIDNITAHLNANDSVTNISVHNRDMFAFASARGGLKALMADFAALSDTMAMEISRKRLDIVPIQHALPEFNIDINAGTDNFLSAMLAESDLGYDHLSVEASNDSIIHLSARVLGARSGATRIDTLDARAWQHDSLMLFNVKANSAPGIFDDFAHVTVSGYFTDRKAGLTLLQRNIKNDIGFSLGLRLRAPGDSTIVAQFVPSKAIIGYKNWQINADNFIQVNLATKRLGADLHMQSDKSALALYTLGTHADNGEHVAMSPDSIPHATDGAQTPVVLKLDNIYLQDWLTLNPWAPPIEGAVNADMQVTWSQGALNGNGTVALDNLYYNRERVGSFLADMDIETNTSGLIRATTDIYVDSVKTITIAGALNDSTRMSPFNLDFSMIRLPLAIANPFLPAGTAKLQGALNGQLQISGDQSAPLFNGSLNFDSASVMIPMLGTAYPFSSEPIEMKDNVVQFRDFGIEGVNHVPLAVNGTVEIADMTLGHCDLSLKTSNMQLLNSNRAARGADLYGKAFVDIDATARGNLELMDINADVRLRSTTNVTYVLGTTVAQLSEPVDEDMVHFVAFADSSYIAQVDSLRQSSMALNIDALLTLEQGNVINVDLGGSNRAQVQASGTVNYTQNAPSLEGRMTGRIDINQGFVRYSNMIISEKNFTFDPGSYVAFNGDLLNPTLHVSATDAVRANVTQAGQNSRVIDFDVTVDVGGTLDQMDLSFDLATDQDVTVANELQSMSKEQRANQAMNLLLYGIYTGPGTKASANLGGNALYSFMTSQLNSWAAQNIKGVDLSFGVDQYNTTRDGASSTTTSYSYQVSKSLFDNRFKIIVGGNYSTDADADENFSQNLISDISFEYMLNKRGSMLIRLFRHTGYESILEGEITQTGVGFVYKRRIQRISDMFRFLRRKHKKPVPEPPTPAQTTNNE